MASVNDSQNQASAFEGAVVAFFLITYVLLSVFFVYTLFF